eukprot:1158642-Pelagomonas_calceolata.AAC.2
MSLGRGAHSCIKRLLHSCLCSTRNGQRVKSISMSNYSEQEVNDIEMGGNEVRGHVRLEWRHYPNS